jgi:membrane protein implicated in regulation of membrane protease activity
VTGWLATIDPNSHWWWLVFAVILGIGEIVIPGIFLFWIAIAAAVTGLVTIALGIPLAAQIVLFAVLCLIATWLGRKWYADNPVASQDPLLNDRAARLIGEVLTVVEPIVDGHGRVRVGDGAWPCRGPDAALGARVRVTGADGASLLVEPA